MFWECFRGSGFVSVPAEPGPVWTVVVLCRIKCMRAQAIGWCTRMVEMSRPEPRWWR